MNYNKITVSNKPPQFVRWALLAAIVIVLNVFFFVFQQTVFPSPKYSNYCPTPSVTITSADACNKQGGEWKTPPPSFQFKQQKTITGYCDYYTKCQPAYEHANDTQHVYAFILMVVLGISALVIGFLPIGSSIVSAGLSYGGVLALIISSMRYWSNAGSLLRLGIATIALTILIYIGIHSFKDKQPKDVNTTH